MNQIPDGYKKNALGHLVPVDTIKEDDLVRDQFVSEAISEAKLLALRVAEFKLRLSADLQAFIELSAERYEANIGGQRGNVTLTSFDGRYQVMRAISDQLEFDEKLQAAKALIDDCLREWTSESGPEIRALIDNAFQVDKKGKINTKRILSLRRLNIKHAKWQRAMEAIGDALMVTGSRVYFRLYERDDKGGYVQIPLDFSSI